MTDKKVYSDFWLNKDSIKEYLLPDKEDGFTVDLIQLASYRRLVSNFIYILTHKDITVQFCNDAASQLSFTDGQKIYLSSSIRRKSDFDWSVGIALHEATHIVVTDFDLIKTMFGRIPIPVPDTVRRKSKEKNITDKQLFSLCQWVWNFTEDRFIDSYTFKEAPGYRGYYKAMYNKFWNSKIISKGIKSKAYRERSLKSYEFRVINLTNPDTELDVLPGLEEIADLLQISNILRLKKTTDRLDLAYQIVGIIIDNIDKQPTQPEEENGADVTIKEIHDKLIGNVGNVVKDKEKPDPKEGMGDISDFNPSELDELISDFKDLKDFLNHDYQKFKESASKKQKAMLDAIEKLGMTLVPVGYGLEGDYTQAKVDCIVGKKMTKELIMSPEQFPFSCGNSWGVSDGSEPTKVYEEFVNKGFELGRLLGRKLQIRGEEKITKYIRKPTGKIERRLLAGIGAGLEDIFSKTIIEKYNKARLHISIDGSGSMSGHSKWGSTMVCVVGICVAASMIENLTVSVSIRSTMTVDASDLPYIVLAYDSEVDEVSKIKQLFSYLRPNGGTPEGLAFEAIYKEFIVGKKTNEQDHYFLNISDGEPAFSLYSRDNKYGTNFDYTGESGARHTKKQVDKIRSEGVKVLSYFIADSTDTKSSMGLKGQFQLMYGKDAQFIDVQKVTDIARTINNLFLSKV